MNATLFSNHNLSRSDISVRYVFQKMFSPKGTLVAVECLSRFDSLSISRKLLPLCQYGIAREHIHGATGAY
jgi:hypothetical protein